MTWRVFAFCLLCIIAGPVSAGTLSWVTQDRWVTVNKVIDGDTFVTHQGEKVRLLGINTPEVRHESSPAQPFGKEAKLALQALLQGEQVRLSFDQDKKDKYGRTLAHVYLRDGTWVNAQLLDLGLAHVYTFVPNISKAAELVAIEQSASARKIGIWEHRRWEVLTPKRLKTTMLGDFRLIEGVITARDNKGWKFSLGKLNISIPRKYRDGFRRWQSPKKGDQVVVRGRLRMSKKGQWYISIHTPSDLLRLN